jgi:release factor glutamine methyltransferase
VALALAHERPRGRYTATDACAAALAVAGENASRLGIANIEFRLGDWCAALHGERYDLIVSNPPYVAEDDPVLTQGGLQFEPRAALAAGRDGMDALRRIACEARHCLRPGGWLLLEHGCTQGQHLRRLLAALGYQGIAERHDYARLERVVEARWQQPGAFA